MALTHNVQQEPDSIYFGNCLLFAGRYTGVAGTDFSSSNLINLGLKRSVEYEPITETIQPEFDDGEFNDLIDTEQARISVELTELVAEKIALLSGGTQFVRYTLGTPVTMGVGVYEEVTLSGTRPVRLANRSYTTSAFTQVTGITVKEDTDDTPDTYIADTDYVISGPDLMGYTTIARKATSVSIVDGQKVRVAYEYTPAKIISLRRGGATEISPIVLRVIHVKAIRNNLIYGLKLDLVKAYFNKANGIKFTSDKEKKSSWGLPYEFLGKLDANRTLESGQLDLIDTLRGVTLTDLNMANMPDLDLAIMKNAAVGT